MARRATASSAPRVVFLRCAKQPHGDELAGLVISAIVRECTTGVVEHNVQICGRPFIEVQS
jgi:hypothetical protein